MSRLPHARRQLRLILALIGIGIVLGVSLVEVQAQTTAETDVTIKVIDEGTLDVTWATSDATFLANGEAPALTAANPSITASATFALAIDDTRTDGNRAGYAISLRASALTVDGSGTAIEPNRLTIAAIDGLPEAAAIGQSLGAPVTVLTVDSGADAVSTTVTITVELTLVPGDQPGAYQGGLTFDVTPLTSP